MAIQVQQKALRNNLPPMGNVNGSIRPSNANILNVLENGEMQPVLVKEVSLLGTSSEFNESYYKEDADTERLNTPNPQTVDIAHLEPETDTFCIQGSINFVPQCMGFANCDENKDRAFELADLAAEAMREMKKNGGMAKLARLYAIQLTNGDILFRNKYAQDLRAVVSFQDDGSQQLEFDCRAEDLGSPTGIDALAGYIEKALTEEGCYFHPVYKIYGRINYGGEVYPSQELEMSNRKKVLFRNKFHNEPNAAGLHSQKIGNAIRTIDTWYSRFNEIGRAIPVDPYGPDKSRAKAVRRPGTGETFYEILAGLDQLSEKLKKQGEPDGDAFFFAAMMVRGGVFSGSKKAKQEAA